MTSKPNAVIAAEEPKRKKRGGKLSGNRSHQGTKSPSSGSAKRHEALA